MHDVAAIILGGGRGSRLYPLTKYRAKPALPLAGKYRLIDIPMSHCINSDVLKIYILTQFNSASLNNHIANTYHFSPFFKGFVQVLAAQQTPATPDWFQGTADAVRKILWVIAPVKVNDYLVLAGDHLYRMDYRKFIGHHRKTNADVTISAIPVNESKATNFGLVKIDRNGRVIDFKEKPKGDALRIMEVDVQTSGGTSNTTTNTPYLASMGIYVFRSKILHDLLARNLSHTDFGQDIIPSAIPDYNVQTYLFTSYWEDIGTIETFYRANLDLVKQPKPLFSFFDAEFPIYTHHRSLPPSKILNSHVEESMICDGCIVKSSSMRNSIIGIRSRLDNNCSLENTLVMGADYYQMDEERSADLSTGIPPLGIGEHTVIRNAIIDKNARIGKNVEIINKNGVQNLERDSAGYWIRNGITIIIKDAIIPDNTVI